MVQSNNNYYRIASDIIRALFRQSPRERRFLIFSLTIVRFFAKNGELDVWRTKKWKRFCKKRFAIFSSPVRLFTIDEEKKKVEKRKMIKNRIWNSYTPCFCNFLYIFFIKSGRRTIVSEKMKKRHSPLFQIFYKKRLWRMANDSNCP